MVLLLLLPLQLCFFLFLFILLWVICATAATGRLLLLLLLLPVLLARRPALDLRRCPPRVERRPHRPGLVGGRGASTTGALTFAALALASLLSAGRRAVEAHPERHIIEAEGARECVKNDVSARQKEAYCYAKRDRVVMGARQC